MDSNIRRMHQKTEQKCPICGSYMHIVPWSPLQKSNADMQNKGASNETEPADAGKISPPAASYSLMCLNCSFGFNFDGK